MGAYYGDKLVAVMLFKHNNTEEWELVRCATAIDNLCIGVCGKLFKYFVRKYNPNEIKSFADRRWTIDEENNLYLQLGFKFDSYIKPDYRYYIQNRNERIHKFNFRKKNLNRKYGFPLTMTETEMVQKINAYRIWDCGLIKYVWKKR